MLYTDQGKSGVTCVIQGKVCLLVAVALIVTVTTHLVLVTVYTDHAIFWASSNPAPQNGRPEMRLHMNLPANHGDDFHKVKAWHDQHGSSLDEPEDEEEPLYDHSLETDPIENKDVVTIPWDLEDKSIKAPGPVYPKHEDLHGYIPHQPFHVQHHDPEFNSKQHKGPNKGGITNQQLQNMLKQFGQVLTKKIVKQLTTALDGKHAEHTAKVADSAPDSTHGKNGKHDSPKSKHEPNSKGSDRTKVAPLGWPKKYGVDLVRASSVDQPLENEKKHFRDLYQPDFFEIQGDSPVLSPVEATHTEDVNAKKNHQMGPPHRGSSDKKDGKRRNGRKSQDEQGGQKGGCLSDYTCKH